MNRTIVSLFSGLLFAIGLALAGMTDPLKVISFLDFTGAWDPSLAFVMGGAILVYAPVYRLITRASEPRFDSTFHLPTRKDIDLRLVAGAAMFGLGWGLSGFCPGPALVSVMSFGTDALVFGASMAVGMVAFGIWQQRRA
ncbi:MAG: DUF6691 family protein [Myxococcota bacterium]